MSNPSILILPGDGIGPEVMAEVRKIIDWFGTQGTTFDVSEDLVGGAAYDKHGTPLHDDTMARAQEVDAVLLGAVGGPKYDDLDFSVPAGVDLVTPDDNVHAGSVLVRHRKSGIVHVDDTLNVLSAPGPLGKVLPQSSLKFHPMLSSALQKRAGAADDFARWARGIADDWAGTPIVCAAHSAIRHLPERAWNEEVLDALLDVDDMLGKHRAEYG